jgi:hypothetical protein
MLAVDTPVSHDMVLICTSSHKQGCWQGQHQQHGSEQDLQPAEKHAAETESCWQSIFPQQRHVGGLTDGHVFNPL